MVSCSFPSCPNQNNGTDGVRYYEFPLKNVNLLEKWVSAVNRKDWLPSKDAFICENHFSESCFVDGTLKENAVPEADYEFKNYRNSPTGENVPQQPPFFSQLCRLCGKKNSKEMADIFDKSLQIFKKMSMCLPVVVLSYDSLPKQVCLDCLAQLDVSFNLFMNSIATEKKFKKSLQVLRSKTDTRGSSLVRLPLEGPIECDICGSAFTDMALFDSHVEEHRSELLEPDSEDNVLITCTKCGYLFKEEEEYKEHKKPASRECLRCGTILQSACLGNSHECPEKFCHFCGIPFRNHSVLAEHMTKIHSIKIDSSGSGVLCETCQVVLAFQEESLKNHSCFQSNQVFSEMRPQLMNQLDFKKFAGSRLYICHVCGHVFESQKEMIKHQALHGKEGTSEEGSWECKTCGERAEKKEELTLHCLREHAPPVSAWTCKFCGKSMTTKLSLSIHERIHSGVKPFICERCGNGFRSRANLMQHQAVHTGVRNHPCPKCGKKFSRKSFVRTHLRVHTGERPFCCDLCGQRFTQVGDMRRHRSRHRSAAAAASSPATVPPPPLPPPSARPRPPLRGAVTSAP